MKDASVHLRRLRDLGLLTMKGAGNKTYYIPGEGFKAKEGGNGQSHQPDAQTHQPDAQTHQPEAQTHQPEAKRHQLERQLPETLKARLPVPGSRPSEDAIRYIVIDLCSVQPWNASELLCLLGRKDRKQLVRAFLSPMVEEGLLAYTIPQMVNHPEQRYMVPEKEVAAPPAH